jgi:hypothetical protein
MDDLSAHKGKRVRELVEARGCELLVYLATLLAGLYPHRGSLRQDRGSCAEGPSQDPSGFGRGAGRGALGGHGYGRSRLLRALRVPQDGSIVMTNAVRGSANRRVANVSRNCGKAVE